MYGRKRNWEKTYMVLNSIIYLVENTVDPILLGNVICKGIQEKARSPASVALLKNLI